MKEINVGKVKSDTLFIYNGKKYQFKSIAEAWRQLCDENGEPIPPQEIPNDILFDRVKVEVLDDNK